jgi:hypothetical protein
MSNKDKERKELFDKYTSINDELEFTKKHLLYQSQLRSLIVKQIYEQFGVGPYRHKGNIMTVSSRTNKLTGEETYFFKSPSIDLEEI